jgi:hypothetical protein
MPTELKLFFVLAITIFVIIFTLAYWYDFRFAARQLYYGKKKFAMKRDLKYTKLSEDACTRRKIVYDFLKEYKPNSDELFDCIRLVYDAPVGLVHQGLFTYIATQEKCWKDKYGPIIKKLYARDGKTYEQFLAELPRNKNDPFF